MLTDEDEEDDEVEEVLTLPLQAHHAMEKMEEFVHKVITKVGRANIYIEIQDRNIIKINWCKYFSLKMTNIYIL